MPILSKKLVDEILIILGKTENDLRKPIECIFPDHSDNTPSLSISLEKQVFNCFGCHKKGSLVVLYEELTGKELPVDISVVTKEANYLDVAPESILPTIDFVTQETFRQKYLELLEKRKIKQETLDILGAQVCMIPDHKFYGYICFGHDSDENFLVGRWLLDENPKRPKYMYWKGSKPLLGVTWLDTSLGYAILVESIFNWLTLVQRGFKNVICCFGTHVTKNELYRLVDRVKTVLIAFDKDFAGFDGSKSMSETLAEFGIGSIHLSIPLGWGNDINDALQKGLEDEIDSYFNSKVNMILENDDTKLNDIEWVEKYFAPNAPELPCYPTGLDRLDTALDGGLTPGLVSILGDTSQGKSALSIFLMAKLLEANQDRHLRFLYVTHEISRNQVLSRLLSMSSILAWNAIEKKKSLLSDDDRNLIRYLVQFVHVREGLTMESVFEMAENYDVIVIDYMQAAPRTNVHMYENRADFLGTHYSNMRRYGERKNKIFVALSSVSKVDYKNKKTASVKGAGDGDYSPYLTFLVKREEDDTGQSHLKCFIEKNTRGQAQITIHFEADFAHNNFREVDEKNFAD